MPLVPITDAPEQARPQAEQPDPVYLMMAGAMMHQEGRLFKTGSQIRDEMEGSVLEEKLGRDGADTIKSMDKLMGGPFKKEWDDKTRQHWIDQQQRDLNKDQYPKSPGPTKVGIG